MDAYDAAGWESWSVAEAGASAALSGLVFVAVSINLARILAHPGLPRRAAETIAILVNVLIASTLTLAPGQSATLLGAELLVAALIVWSLTTALQLRGLRVRVEEKQPRGWIAGRMAMSQLATLPFVVAGATLLAGAGGGLYWLVPGVVFSFLTGVADA
jgi:hypothetical protein